MDNKILVSVIMPIFNSEKFISQSIESVLAQTFTEWELIIVDDCSTDGSLEIAKNYAGKRDKITILQNEKNSGAAYSRNYGIANAKGRFICFLDADDIMAYNKIQNQVEYMLKNNLAFTYTNYSRIDENGAVIKDKMKLMPKCDYKGAICQMPMLLSTVMLDTAVLPKEEIKMPIIATSEDRACFSHLLKLTDYAYLIDQTLCLYRVHKGSLSSGAFSNAKLTWQFFRKVEKLNFFKSSYYFMLYAFAAIKKRK